MPRLLSPMLLYRRGSPEDEENQQTDILLPKVTDSHAFLSVYVRPINNFLCQCDIVITATKFTQKFTKTVVGLLMIANNMQLQRLLYHAVKLRLTCFFYNFIADITPRT